MRLYNDSADTYTVTVSAKEATRYNLSHPAADDIPAVPVAFTFDRQTHALIDIRTSDYFPWVAGVHLADTAQEYARLKMTPHVAPSTLIRLQNDFHNTAYCIRVRELPHQLTDSQHRRVERALCGMSDCTCGTISGPQYHDGKRLRVEWEPDIFGDLRLTIDYEEE